MINEKEAKFNYLLNFVKNYKSTLNPQTNLKFMALLRDKTYPIILRNEEDGSINSELLFEGLKSFVPFLNLIQTAVERNEITIEELSTIKNNEGKTLLTALVDMEEKGYDIDYCLLNLISDLKIDVTQPDDEDFTILHKLLANPSNDFDRINRRLELILSICNPYPSTNENSDIEANSEISYAAMYRSRMEDHIKNFNRELLNNNLPTRINKPALYSNYRKLFLYELFRARTNPNQKLDQNLIKGVHNFGENIFALLKDMVSEQVKKGPKQPWFSFNEKKAYTWNNLEKELKASDNPTVIQTAIKKFINDNQGRLTEDELEQLRSLDKEITQISKSFQYSQASKPPAPTS